MTTTSENVLDRSTVFGNVDVQPFFGNVEERGVPPTPEPDAPTLRIRGTVVFGNAELERF